MSENTTTQPTIYAEGQWCADCLYFEGEDSGTHGDRCATCGCLLSSHVPAEVVAPPTPTPTPTPIGRRFRHSRKGILVGEVIAENGDWADIRITEEGGNYEVGEVVTCRVSFLTELDADGSEIPVTL